MSLMDSIKKALGSKDKPKASDQGGLVFEERRKDAKKIPWDRRQNKTVKKP